MNIRYFFRHPVPDYHSIEELFDTIIKHIPGSLKKSTYILPFISNGLFKRAANIFSAAFNQREINHITGDTHYIALLMRKNKTLLTIHDVEIIKRKRGVKRMLLIFFWFYLPAMRVKYITVISEFTKKEILEIINVKPSKIFVIPDCVNVPMSQVQKSFNSACPSILHVGTKQNKNLERLVKAIEGIQCKLIILGRLSREQILLLNQKSIIYQNYFDLTYEKVIELYQDSDILSFISTYEGFGMPILEAQAVGIPVLASRSASIPDVAGNGALFVNPYSINEIRAGLINIINNNELRNMLIINGRKNAERYKVQNIVNQYIDLYKRM
jgi:glycosyltransferase involved in cell wall biosynthesis